MHCREADSELLDSSGRRSYAVSATRNTRGGTCPLMTGDREHTTKSACTAAGMSR
jgi:hypothetical protein